MARRIRPCLNTPAIALIACLTAAAQAQDDGPIVVGVKKDWGGVKFENFDFALDFTAEYQRDRIAGDDRPTQHDRFTEFQETLTASTTGFIGHPNLIHFDLSGTFGLSQQFIDSESSNRDEDPIETIEEYDVRAMLLGQSNTPSTIYSTRTRTNLARQFGDTIDSVVTESGFILLLRNDVLPTSVHYFHRNESQTSQTNTSNYFLVQDTVEWESQYRPAANQSLLWNYTMDSIDQSGNMFQNDSYIRQTGLLTHNLDFGDKNQNNLRSALFMFNQTGDFPTTRMRLDENLRLFHNPDFETLYNYSLNWTDTDDTNQLFQRADAGLRYDVFDSLVIGANIGGSYLTADPGSFSSGQAFGDLFFDYDKQVPLGMLTAGLAVAGVYVSDSDRGSPLQVNDDLRTFGPSGIIVIERRNVEPNSIRVSDAAGIVVYIVGVDYTVSAFDDRVEIRRVLGGAIAPGQIVSIDYEIGPEPGSTTTTLGLHARVRYDFQEGPLKGLGVYARYFHQDQDIREKGPVIIVPADVNALIFGADYTLGPLTLSAEREMHDSTLSPFDATRLSATYLQPLGLGSSLAFNANFDDIDRYDDGTHSTIASFGGRWNQRIDDKLTISLGALWQTQSESPGTDVHGFEQVLEVTWRHRQTTIFGSIRNSMNDSTAVDSQYLNFQFGLRREF